MLSKACNTDVYIVFAEPHWDKQVDDKQDKNILLEVIVYSRYSHCQNPFLKTEIDSTDTQVNVSTEEHSWKAPNLICDPYNS